MFHFSSTRYYDGLNAKSILVEVEATHEKLIFKNKENDTSISWLILSTEILENPSDGRPGLCLNQQNPDARLILNVDLYAYLNKRLNRKNFDFTSKKAISFLIVLTIAFFTIFLYSLPNFSTLIANYIPLSVEKALGDYSEHLILSSLDYKIIENKTLNKIVTHLTRNTESTQPIKIYLIDSKDPPNAFALPNGKIYIYKSLIQSANSPDELTGVIAHEIAHILKHHSTINMLRYLNLSLLIKSSTGFNDIFDITGLLINPYSQEAEIEADTLAAEILFKSQTSSAGLKNFFEKIGDTDSDSILSRFLSTHPSSEIRLKNLQLLPTTQSTKSILTEKEWLALKVLAK